MSGSHPMSHMSDFVLGFPEHHVIWLGHFYTKGLANLVLCD